MFEHHFKSIWGIFIKKGAKIKRAWADIEKYAEMSLGLLKFTVGGAFFQIFEEISQIWTYMDKW